MNNRVELIRKSGISIYSPIQEQYFIPDIELQTILIKSLVGRKVDYPIKTRSKVMKTLVAESLGYTAPKTFTKTYPRFPNQDLDIFSQQSNNIQVWNVPIVSDHRYGIVRINDEHVVTDVRVIRGSVLASWDHTGTLTRKYQAHFDKTKNLARVLSKDEILGLNPSCHTNLNPMLSILDEPSLDNIIPIENLGTTLEPLIGLQLPYGRKTDERKRGDVLHQQISKLLCYEFGKDNGQFPDIPNQLLEVKFQTSPTIDLGLHQPNSSAIINSKWATQFTLSMARYLIISGEVIAGSFTITSFHLCSGKEFYNHFTRFEGMITNEKLQIPFPLSLFK